MLESLRVLVGKIFFLLTIKFNFISFLGRVSLDVLKGFHKFLWALLPSFENWVYCDDIRFGSLRIFLMKLLSMCPSVKLGFNISVWGRDYGIQNK